ncbi:MAG TPA: hypothetical protein VK616_07975 [Flavitalea sp.]|nr:hypothetical protein [Flavitalea sp.]HTF28333.1 hypothetical protein [Flavitalea sp.]
MWFNDELDIHDEFDNKVNVLRTDPVLQFIRRNYSMNNQLPGPTSYNNMGLPLTYNEDQNDPYSAIAFEYTCKK